MKFREILKRVNGVNGGVFGISAGISWNQTKTDKDHIKELVHFLEDRRVLYNPGEMEVPAHCIQSILDIRQHLTTVISSLRDAETSLVIKNMRSACRKFLNTVEDDPEVVSFGSSRGHRANWLFNGALGELRGVFGIYLTLLAQKYKLDIENDLATILPISDD